MTKNKNQQHIEEVNKNFQTPLQKATENLVKEYTRAVRKANRLRKQIMREIEEDWVLFDLTSPVQSYSF